MPCQHLIEDYSQGVDIDAIIYLESLPLLWGHVLRGAHGHHGPGQLRSSHRLGYAQVSQNGPPVLSDQDVAGLDVAMYDALLVSTIEGLSYLLNDAQPFLQFHVSALSSQVSQPLC